MSGEQSYYLSSKRNLREKKKLGFFSKRKESNLKRACNKDCDQPLYILEEDQCSPSPFGKTEPKIEGPKKRCTKACPCGSPGDKNLYLDSYLPKEQGC